MSGGTRKTILSNLCYRLICFVTIVFFMKLSYPFNGGRDKCRCICLESHQKSNFYKAQVYFQNLSALFLKTERITPINIIQGSNVTEHKTTITPTTQFVSETDSLKFLEENEYSEGSSG